MFCNTNILKALKNVLKRFKMLKTESEYKINLLILRDTFSDKSTIGELFLNGEFMCDTLENPYINNERNH